MRKHLTLIVALVGLNLIFLCTGLAIVSVTPTQPILALFIVGEVNFLASAWISVIHAHSLDNSV